MFIAILVLFFTVVLSGFLVKLFPPNNVRWLKMALAFSGAYLFTITITHLLPDVLLSNKEPHVVGYWVLAGFFLGMDELVVEKHFVDTPARGPERDRFNGRGVIVENLLRQTGGFREIPSRSAVLDRDLVLFGHESSSLMAVALLPPIRLMLTFLPYHL